MNNEKSKNIVHAVTGIGEATVVVLMSSEVLTDQEVNEYLCSKGFLEYVYLEGSSVTDHMQGISSMMFHVEAPLFDDVKNMHDYYKRELN